MSILDAKEKPSHKQGPNWTVVGRFEDFESADARRKSEIQGGATAKVQKLAQYFVVKVKPPKQGREEKK